MRLMNRFLILALATVAILGCGDKTTPEAKPVATSETVKPVEKAEPAVEAKLIKTDIKVGNGRAAEAGDLVLVDYKGTFDDGKVFDESKGKPPLAVQIGAGRVIKGWEEGLVGMKVGGKRKLHVPSALAYGPEGRDGIPPNTDLNFEINLLGMVKAGEESVVDKKTLKPGTGSIAVKDGDNVSITYEGRLVNGEVFDSSAKHNMEPLSFKVGEGKMVSGMETGVLGMKVGEEREITIPPDVGYGMTPPPGIPPSSILIFKVKLLKIN